MKRLLRGEVARSVQSVLETLLLGHERLDPRPNASSSKLVSKSRLRDGSIAASSTCSRGRDHLRQPRGAAKHVAKQLA